MSPALEKTWTRRDFMIASLLLPAEKKAMRFGKGYIDAHSHVWSPDFQRWPRDLHDPSLQGVPLSFTPEELLAQARPSGVERVVLIQMGFYAYDNSYLLDAVAGHPDRFVAVARVDHTSPGVGKEMGRLAARGVRGYRIVLRDQPAAWVDSVGMNALWQFSGENRLAICPLMDPDAIPALARMCERHPATPVVIDHLARIGAKGPIRDEDVASLCALARHPRVHVKVSAFYALGQGPAPYLHLVPMIRRVFDAYGAHRLMWGSDSPYQVIDGHRYADSIALVHDHLDFLTRVEREEMLRGTAERIFFPT